MKIKRVLIEVGEKKSVYLREIAINFFYLNPPVGDYLEHTSTISKSRARKVFGDRWSPLAPFDRWAFSPVLGPYRRRLQPERWVAAG